MSGNKEVNIIGRILVFLIICATIAAFFLLGNNYSLKNRKPRRVELPQSLFKNENSGSYDFEMSKYELPIPVYSLDILDNNLIFFSSSASDTMRSIICMLNLDEYEKTGSFLPVYIKPIGDVYHVSPDGQKIAYISIRNKNSVNLYDIKSTGIIYYDNMKFLAWLPDSSGFVAMDQENLLVMPLTVNEKPRIIVNRKTISKQIIDHGFVFPNDEDSPFNIWNTYKISNDAKKLYFQQWNEKIAKSFIYSIDLTDGHVDSFDLKGYLSEFEILNNGNIIFTGIIEDKDGMYLYNTETRSVRKILHASISSFSIAPDNKKIVYNIVSRQRATELYLASFDNYRLSNDKIIFNDPNYMYQIKWNSESDMFFLSTAKLGESTIYRFKQVDVIPENR